MEKNVYDEKVYLSKDEEALDTFYKKRECYALLCDIEREKNNELIKEYNRYLLVSSKFLKSLDLNNSLEYCVAISYLIHKGYFSLDKEFSSVESRGEINSRYGTTIVRGNGCCRNFSDMTFDLMRLMDFFVKELYCYQPNLSLPKSARLKSANHVINVVEFEGVKYGFDLYNGPKLFSFKNPFVLKEISTFDSSMLRNKPYYEIIVDGLSIDDILRELEEYRIESKKQTISPYEYERDILFKTREYLTSQKSMLEDFHESTNEMKLSIAKKLVSVKLF